MPSPIMIMMQSGSTKSSLLQRIRLSAPGFLVSWKSMKIPRNEIVYDDEYHTNDDFHIIRPIIDFRHMHSSY